MALPPFIRILSSKMRLCITAMQSPADQKQQALTLIVAPQSSIALAESV
jgi:hypothetical protein